MSQHFRIIGSARYLPSTRITADELDKKLGLSAGWTATHTGVLNRFQACEPETPASMIRQVVSEALRDACLKLSAIDLIIDASLCIQQPIPCNGALVQQALGEDAAGIPAFDVHASCLGFIAALNTVNGLLATGSARRVLIVNAEMPLKGVNWAEPESACLMGDAATAIIVERRETPLPGCSFKMQTFADGAELCEIRGGGLRLPVFDYHPALRSEYQFHMEGKSVHKTASRRLPPLIDDILAAASATLDELEIIPHQASGPALEFVRRRLGIARERFHATIADHGNLVAASIPFVLHQVRKIKPSGTRVMIVGTAAGYTQAAAIFSL